MWHTICLNCKTIKKRRHGFANIHEAKHCRVSRLLSYLQNASTQKLKDEVRGNKCLFEIQKKSYSESTDWGRNPSSVLIRRRRQWVFVRKGGDNDIDGRRHFYSYRRASSDADAKQCPQFQSRQSWHLLSCHLCTQWVGIQCCPWVQSRVILPF